MVTGACTASPTVAMDFDVKSDAAAPKAVEALRASSCTAKMGSIFATGLPTTGRMPLVVLGVVLDNPVLRKCCHVFLGNRKVSVQRGALSIPSCARCGLRRFNYCAQGLGAVRRRCAKVRVNTHGSRCHVPRVYSCPKNTGSLLVYSRMFKECQFVNNAFGC